MDPPAISNNRSPDLFAEQSLDELHDEPDDDGEPDHVDVRVAHGQRLLAVHEEVVRVLRVPHGHVRVPDVWRGCHFFFKL